jgi:hypothetical protein
MSVEGVCGGTMDTYRPELGRHIHQAIGGGQVLQVLETDVRIRAMADA